MLEFNCMNFTNSNSWIKIQEDSEEDVKIAIIMCINISSGKGSMQQNTISGHNYRFLPKGAIPHLQ